MSKNCALEQGNNNGYYLLLTRPGTPKSQKSKKGKGSFISHKGAHNVFLRPACHSTEKWGQINIVQSIVKSVWTIKKSHSIGCGLSNDSLTNVTVTVNKLKGSRFESHSESKAVFWLIDLSIVCVRSRGQMDWILKVLQVLLISLTALFGSWKKHIEWCYFFMGKFMLNSSHLALGNVIITFQKNPCTIKIVC